MLHNEQEQSTAELGLGRLLCDWISEWDNALPFAGSGRFGDMYELALRQTTSSYRLGMDRRMQGKPRQGIGLACNYDCTQ